MAGEKKKGNRIGATKMRENSQEPSMETAEVALGQSADGDAKAAITIDPRPTFDLSPHLYMQFMEPLGTNDGSVEASWVHLNDRWRPDLIKATQSLAPAMMRWGGIFCDYYHWREAVGPRDRRVPMYNLLWGGIESNQIGTAEFVDFCRQVDADPLICVNFESDGRPHFFEAKGSSRIGDAGEAADWVEYCNSPHNPERRTHGFEKPFGVKYWQIGNETSYDRRGFDLETAARKTVENTGQPLLWFPMLLNHNHLTNYFSWVSWIIHLLLHHICPLSLS